MHVLIHKHIHIPYTQHVSPKPRTLAGMRPVGRYNVHQLAVFDYMVEKEWMLHTYETNFKKTNGNKVGHLLLVSVGLLVRV